MTKISAFPLARAAHLHRHCILVVSPEGYSHSAAFDDVATALSHAFDEIGGSAPIVRRVEDCAGRIPIVLGAPLLPHDAVLPTESIIFNLEQVDGSSGWFSPLYFARMQVHPVLDYSHVNRARLQAAGVAHAELLPLGYAAPLTRSDARSPRDKDIDVLFYGSPNPRRSAVLDLLRGEGVTVVSAFDVYGAARAQLIARAKVVLNLHFYDASIFESARVVYLMANGAAIVTEGSHDDPDLAALRPGLAVCRYPRLAGTCRHLIADDFERARLGRQAFETVRQHPQAAHLSRLLGNQERQHGT